MILAQTAQPLDLTTSSLETKSLVVSHRRDASLSRWSSSSPRRSASWETKQWAEELPSTLAEEFSRVKIQEESTSISTITKVALQVQQSQEHDVSTSFIFKLHPSIQQLCEDEYYDEDDVEYSELTPDSTPVVQLPSVHEGTLSDDDSIDSEWDEDNENEILAFLYSLKANVLIESMNPKIAPHIVITPCEDTWDEHTVAWFNRVGPQLLGNLQVPNADVSEFVKHPQHDYRVPSDLATTTIPRLVFNRTKFEEMISRSSLERIIMFEVTVFLRKRAFKEVAFQASREALSFRQCYDTQLPFAKLEKPFRWTDPAEPLLSCYRKLHGSTFLDSPSPFRVPHIVISAPPPENVWYKWSNQLNNPQDHGFGRYLVVPSHNVDFINDPNEIYYQENHEEVEDYGVSFTSTIEFYRTFTTDDSEDDDVYSPGPETPTEEHDEHDDFRSSFERALEFKFSQTMSAADPRSFCQQTETRHDHDDLALTRCGTSVLVQEFEVIEEEAYNIYGAESISRPSCRPQLLSSSCHEEQWSHDDDEDSDDEDGLPSLDDEWYQSVIRRTNPTLQT